MRFGLNEEAINAIQDRLTVVESAKQSGMIALTLTGEDPGKIATVLNTIAENYLSQNILEPVHFDKILSSDAINFIVKS